MSRELDPDQEKWSEDDWEYARQRPEVYGLTDDEVEQIRPTSVFEGAPPEFDDDYDEWKLNELKEEAGRREISVQGNTTLKATFVDALREWDRNNPEGVVTQG